MFNVQIHLSEEDKHLLHKLMSALNSLNQNITDLTAAVDRIPQVGTPPVGGATEAQVQTAADAVAVQTGRIVALTTPPATPAP